MREKKQAKSFFKKIIKICFFRNSPIFYLGFAQLFLMSSLLQAESKNTAGEDASLSMLDPAYSFYLEKYSENKISGIVFSGHKKDSKSWFNPSMLMGVKFGIFQSNQGGDSFVWLPAIDLGFGVSYGRNLYMYSDIGFDLVEMISATIINIQEDENSIDFVDKFFTVGIGVRDKNVGVSAYAKLNKITGVSVRDNTAIYYGVKVTYFH